ncbi:MAG: Rieske 2Fe-2S domain-containing protein [Candidatus Binatia bacterium]
MGETPKPSSGPVSCRIYRRTIGASLERVWENVLDWEHLPWLHRSTFRRIDLLESNADGWRADLEFVRELGGGSAEVEVVLARADLFYTTRTLAGSGSGTEIVTRLERSGEDATRIEVDFRVPGVTEDQREAVGDAMETVYARLWDEDEAMMRRRQHVLDRARAERGAGERAEVSSYAEAPRRRMTLGRRTVIEGCLPVTISAGGQGYRLAEVDGEILAFSVLCPHRGGPLDRCEPRDGIVECPWHGYRFDVRSGCSSEGRELRLAAAPAVRHDPKTDELALVW